MKRLDLPVCPANLPLSLAAGKLADDSLTKNCNISTAWRPLVSSHFTASGFVSVVIN